MYRQSSLLIVDDNEMNRDILSRRLMNEGYAITTANNGHAALEMMQVERFDLILLDLKMPEMDGFEVLEHIMATPILCDTPVVILTGESDKDSVLACMQFGAKDYIVKPFEIATVKMRIWRCLENRRIDNKLHKTTGNSDHIGARILVVDDNELNRQILGARLKHAGYEPVCVEHPEQALDLLRTGAFDLIMLDIMMPGIDGYELLGTIKANEEWKNIPVIMASALDDNNTITKCFERGAADYITKPYNAIELKARLQSCIHLKHLQDQEAARMRHMNELANTVRSFE